MIEIIITDDMIERASRLANELGKLRNSIRQGEGNLTGFLGEECVLTYFSNSKRDNDYDHDIFIDGDRIEVKTKDRTVAPKPEYDCSVSAYNTKQDADYYFFVSLLRKDNKYIKGYLLGFIEKKDFINKSRYLKKGDIDPTNNFTVRADCYNIRIKDLHSF